MNYFIYISQHGIYLLNRRRPLTNLVLEQMTARFRNFYSLKKSRLVEESAVHFKHVQRVCFVLFCFYLFATLQ